MNKRLLTLLNTQLGRSHLLLLATSRCTLRILSLLLLLFL